MLTVKQLGENGKYVYRSKTVVFNSGGTPPTPQRKGEFPDEFDTIFENKQEFEKWYGNLVVGLAKLDECLNFCQHFVRESGNIGAYERDGHRYYPVNGTWCGLHDSGRGESGKFFDWAKANFGENWFTLHGRYI